ncbi:hypothetical protein JCM3774_000840 [Rhodotorula dairenensis]
MSSGCISCPDPIGPCPACPSGQVCQQISQSCQTCPKRVCVPDASDSSQSSAGGPSTGATVGGALGGVLGVAAVLAALYFFWWRPRGLAASRNRYSQHLAAKRNSARTTGEKRDSAAGPAAPAGGAGDRETDRATKRTSVHLNLGAPPDGSRISRRNTSPAHHAREGGALVSGRTSEDDDPFGDQDRSSIGTFNDASSIHESEFSFRSSRTNVIPIAYIPPHSSSVSIADAHRDAYGHSQDNDDPDHHLHGRRVQERTPARGGGGASSARVSMPASMASRDSLALAGAELIELNPLPPVLTPDTPAVPLGATANGAPIRPPRSPGLDLNLPKISSPLAAAGGGGGGGASSSASQSQFQSQSQARSQALLSPAAGTALGASRGMSVLMDQQYLSSDDGVHQQRVRSAQSHLSTFTTRSGNSTMSYILDPPQIITPVSAQGVRRVELHQGQAGLIKIGGAAASGQQARSAAAAAVPLPHSPTSPIDAEAATLDPFDDANEERRLSGLLTAGSRQSANNTTNRPVSSATDMSRWTSSSFASDALEGGVQFLQGQTVTFTNPNSPMPPSASSRTTSPADVNAPPPPRTVSGASFDVPTSARSSEAFETGAASRALTNQNSAWSLATVKGDPTLSPSTGAPRMALSQSRDSAASVSTNGTHMSVLEGIPFLGPTDPKRGSSGSTGDDEGSNALGEPMARQVSATSSISLGLPVNVTAASGDSSVLSSASSLSTPPTTMTAPSLSPRGSRPATLSSVDGSSASIANPEEDEDDDDEDVLPAPFLPFAGQRPASSISSSGVDASPARSGGRVQSTAISVRSGFGSGLSQIPFQLGFPSGFGEGEEDEDEREGHGHGNGNGDDEGEDRDGSRRSVMSRDSRFPPSEAGDPDEHKLAAGGAGGAAGSGHEDPLLFSPPPPITPTTSYVPEVRADDNDDPFGSHAEVDHPSTAPFDNPRASVDSLALAMGLSADLDAQAAGQS